MVKVGKRAERRMHGGVTAVGAANGPWAARIIGPRVGRVVGPLAMGDTNRMDGWQIEHVEAHGRHVRQARLAILECAVAAGLASAGARKHLVPRAPSGAFPLDLYTQGVQVGRCMAAI